MSHVSRRHKAFTLVELLVVIGVIAVLVGLLLPTLAGAQGRARDIKCQSNLRQIAQGFFSYAAENKGSMPYGYHYDPAHRVTWLPLGGTDSILCWPAQIGKYMMRGSGGTTDDFLPGIFNCPEAEQAFPHKLSYSMNNVAGIVPEIELRHGTPPRAQLKPPQITWLLKDTALVWDSAIKWSHTAFNAPGSYLMGHDIDNRRFQLGARSPQFRYFTHADIFAHIGPGTQGQNHPILLSSGSPRWFNIDPRTAQSGYPYQGNLRFRHRKQTTCNVAFADGHVGPFTGKFHRDQSIQSHDALRRYFMIKWPPGVPPDPNYPH